MSLAFAAFLGFSILATLINSYNFVGFALTASHYPVTMASVLLVTMYASFSDEMSVCVTLIDQTKSCLYLLLE